jgi:hypothetical protein
MAAGQGFKTFTTGEVLTAADVNGYLMQGVGVFASSTERDAEITSPQEGQFAYLKDTNVTTYYTGSAWANLDTTGMTNPMTTTGDTIYSSSGSTPARLGIGSTGQVLTVSGGIPAWTTLPAASPNSATNRVDTQQTTSSLTYTALATAQSVTLTTGTKVMVVVSSGSTSSTVGYGAYASYAISGATTRAVSDTWATGMDEIARSTATDQQSYVSYQTVTAGSNTFTLQFRAVGGGTAYFKNRQLTVIDLGS